VSSMILADVIGDLAMPTRDRITTS